MFDEDFMLNCLNQDLQDYRNDMMIMFTFLI